LVWRFERKRVDKPKQKAKRKAAARSQSLSERRAAIRTHAEAEAKRKAKDDEAAPDAASCAGWGVGGQLVLVVAADPQRPRGALVATLRRPVQQAVVGHCGLEATGARYVGPVDDPVRSRVHAQARSLGDVPHHVRPAHARVLLDGGRDLA